jgi:hypothetical protein
MRLCYAGALYKKAGATLDDLNEAVTTIEDMERTMRRVFDGAHPLTVDIERHLQNSRDARDSRIIFGTSSSEDSS